MNVLIADDDRVAREVYPTLTDGFGDGGLWGQPGITSRVTVPELAVSTGLPRMMARVLRRVRRDDRRELIGAPSALSAGRHRGLDAGATTTRQAV